MSSAMSTRRLPLPSWTNPNDNNNKRNFCWIPKRSAHFIPYNFTLQLQVNIKESTTTSCINSHWLHCRLQLWWHNWKHTVGSSSVSFAIYRTLYSLAVDSILNTLIWTQVSQPAAEDCLNTSPRYTYNHDTSERGSRHTRTQQYRQENQRPHAYNAFRWMIYFSRKNNVIFQLNLEYDETGNKMWIQWGWILRMGCCCCSLKRDDGTEQNMRVEIAVNAIVLHFSCRWPRWTGRGWIIYASPRAGI